ncbi:sensor histidine kinase [Desulfovibrio inopinatus]|uniref:sensor histidine kinase n=1 Tax=Desulfovibrio inopinatus TaxID=102109 RepID=UPI000403EEE6|nr:ATP-binding protein [Desulfovibrio inopinatus]
MTKAPTQEDDESFGLLKVVSWSSIVLILLSGLVLSIFLANYTRRSILERQQEFALLLAENLNHQIFTRFTLPAVVRYGGVELQQKEQYELLEKVITSTTHSFHVMEVRIYGFNRDVSYATDKALVGRRDMAGEAVEKAIEEGTTSFQLVSRVDNLLAIFDFRAKPETVVLRTYYPLRAERALDEAGPITGVLELSQDISQDYQNVIIFQRIIILSALGVSVALALVVRMILKRADRVIFERRREREQLERELQQQERLASMGRVVAGIAHEIRNPLGIIRSTAELLVSKNKDATDINKKLLQAIFDESKRLSKTVTDFLDYARPKAPRVEDVDVSRLLDQALTFLEPKCHQQNIAQHREYPEHLPIKGDKDLLYRAVYNIVTNAIDAMASVPDKDHSLTVTGNVEAGHVVVSIHDTGPGLSNETKDKLLDPFFTTKDTGTGLGLAITANILESHEAKLELDNAPDGGASFTMTFPA